MSKIVIRSDVTAVFGNVTIDTTQGLKAAADVLQKTWYDELNRPGTGRDYDDKKLRTGKPKGKRSLRVIPVGTKVHRGSKPGLPPAPDTGALRDSIKSWETNEGYRVGSDLWYALFLEYGIGPGFAFRTPVKSYKTYSGEASEGKRALTELVVAPRPHARRALAIASDQMTAPMAGALRTAVAIPVQTINLLAIRRALFAFSATIGNLRGLGINVGVLNKLRGGAVRLQRGVGDFDSYISGNLGERAAFRLVGRQTGRMLGSMTSGIPGRFPRRVANRALSSTVTTPGLRKLFGH